MATTETGVALGHIGTWSGDNPFNVNLDVADYIAAPQHDSPEWSETMFFLVWSPDQKVGIWVHVGVVPEDKTMWWAQTYALLPDGVILVDRSFGRPQGQHVDTGNLALTCTEPGKRWNLAFDGAGEISSRAKLAVGPAGAGPAAPFSFSVDLEAVSPIYDMHAAMGRETLDWDMGAFHHEQSFRTTGEMSALGETWKLDGIAIRDHSRGERNFARFGGHVWNHCVWPASGRSLCVMNMWRPHGTDLYASVCMLMEGGVTEVFHDFTMTGKTEPGGFPEQIDLKFIRADGTRVELTGHTVHNLTMTYAEPNLNLNGNWSAERHGLNDALIADESVVCWEWTDGEVGYANYERAFRNSVMPSPICPLPPTSVFRDDA